MSQFQRELLAAAKQIDKVLIEIFKRDDGRSDLTLTDNELGELSSAHNKLQKGINAVEHNGIQPR